MYPCSYELNRDFESISMSKKSYDSCKKEKLRVRGSFFFYETDYHNDVTSKLQISKRINSKSDYKDYIFVSVKKKKTIVRKISIVMIVVTALENYDQKL